MISGFFGILIEREFLYRIVGWCTSAFLMLEVAVGLGLGSVAT
jgi:hypothetical protein